MDSIFGIPISDLRVTARPVKDPHSDKRRTPKPTIPAGRVYAADRVDVDEGILLWWSRRREVFSGVKSQRAGREYGNEFLDAIRPLNEQDLKDPGIQAQILEIALDFQGINAGHLAPALIALSNTIDLEAFLVEIPSVRTDDTAATIRRAALASLRRNS